MVGFWRLREVSPGPVLLVESGSRELVENLIPHLRESFGEVSVDLVTCYRGTPQGLDERSRVYRVSDYPTKEKRQILTQELAGNDYACAGVICSSEPVMTKWKWMLAWRVPAKLFIVNENGDYFWFDRSNLKTIRHFALFRMGLTGDGAMRTWGRLLLFPFTVAYLLLYAFVVHARRGIRMASRTTPGPGRPHNRKL